MCKINGRKLKQLRMDKGISQVVMARNLGVTPSTVSHYESNLYAPTDETVEKICMMLRISKEEIEIKDISYDFLSNTSKTIDKVRRKRVS